MGKRLTLETGLCIPGRHRCGSGRDGDAVALRACLWMALPTGPAQSSGHRAWRVDAEGSCQGTKPQQGTVPAAC